jgi:hypothetical protein
MARCWWSGRGAGRGAAHGALPSRQRGHARGTGASVTAPSSTRATGRHLRLPRLQRVDGRPTEAALTADARAIVAALPQFLGRDPGPLLLYGESLGAAIAIKLAAEGTGDGLILQSPFTSIRDIVRAQYPQEDVAHLFREVWDSRARIGAVRQPLLVLHGTTDRLVPVAQGETIHAEAGIAPQAVRAARRRRATASPGPAMPPVRSSRSWRSSDRSGRRADHPVELVLQRRPLLAERGLRLLRHGLHSVSARCTWRLTSWYSSMSRAKWGSVAFSSLDARHVRESRRQVRAGYGSSGLLLPCPDPAPARRPSALTGVKFSAARAASPPPAPRPRNRTSARRARCRSGSVVVLLPGSGRCAR